MPDEFKFTIGGADEIARELQSKPPIIARQILSSSLRKSVVPWREQMIQRVQRGWHIFERTKVKGMRGSFGGRSREFGVIARNIRIRVDMGAGSFEGSAAVYPSSRAFWAKFLEFGTKKMRKFPFVVPAFESGKSEVLGLLIADIRQQLNKEMKAS
jgi:HK97 gp10 family phage protein